MVFLSLFPILFFSNFALAGDVFDFFIESGGLWQNRNDTQIPPDSGTRLPIDQFNEGPFFHYRLEGYYRMSQHHALRVVYAPLRIQVGGPIENNVSFNGQNFSSTEDLNLEYQFNSYRLSYLYGFRGFEDDQLNLGFTGKIRDAKTRLSQGGVSTTYDNVGFVPLIYFEYQKAFGKNWFLNLTVDAAIAAQGRAIDGALKLRRLISERSSLGLGFRSLEGGAENQKVFTFSWFNYAVLELKTSF